jgi:hypothetical protein
MTLPHLATGWQPELSVSTGLRVDEVAKLTIFQILDLPVGGDSERFTTMHVTKTKRLVERDVNVPNYLILDLHAYIDGERKECIAVGRRFWIKKKSDEPKALLVNGVAARHVYDRRALPEVPFGCRPNSRKSQLLAIRQSRNTVSGETCSTSAVSSTLRPPK